MKKNELINKTLAGLMIAAMTAGVCPTTAFAVTEGQVAADGTYTKEVTVSDGGDAFTDYKVSVSLKVENGKFSAITVTPVGEYDDDNDTYLDRAENGNSKKNFVGYSSLIGQNATEDTVNSWNVDTKSGATYSSKTVKSALVQAINDAPSATVEVNTANLEAAIAKAKGLTAADYTAESWAKLQTALTAADTALTAKESQDAVDTAASNLNTAIDALVKKPEEVKVNTEKLEAAIAKADALKDKEADYTAESWKTMQTALTEAKSALAAKESQDMVDAAEAKLTKATNELVKATVSTDVYVLMNIPYDKFYEAEGDKDDVDAVTSATLNKTRSSLAAGSYHVNSDGSDITGVTYPVKISDASALEKYKKITDDSKVDITTSIKGKTSTTTYTGKDALFESDSYSYYILSETPSYYKEATVNADGSLSFGKTEGTEVKILSNVTADFKTSSNYGDYQINLSELPSDIKTVYGVVIGTKEGDNYGLRHVENIWKNTKLAWSTGFVTEAHGSPLQYKDYVNMMGQTIDKITYYTNAGVYEIPVDIKVPVKFNGGVKVENGKASDGSVSATVEGLPDDYAAEYSVDGLSDVKLENGKLTFAAAQARGGRYTLTVSDKKHKYADITTTFTLTTDATPITYDSEKASLVTADGYTADDLAAYVKSIESVSVDGTSYAASGKGAVKIIKEDGSIDATAKPFANAKDGQEFEIVVKATGYAKDYTFTYKYEDEDAYVLMNIPYSAFYKAEVNNDVDVDVFTSATLNKTRTASLAGGSYHVNADGSQIDGITFPVKVDKDVDLSKYTQVTDSDSVDITVTNRGQTSTTTYTGKDALFQNADYAYYNLTEVPSYYKEVSVDKDGNLTFGKTVGNVTTLEGLSAELSTETSYGDYQLDIDGLRDKLTELGVTNINGVVINTKEGSSYGLRHLENIWRMEELAWATGFTEAVHGCPTSSDHYKAMMGQRITSVTYYTDKGMYNIPFSEGVYVPIKFDYTLSAENASADSGEAKVTLESLPADYDAEYSVKGLEDVKVENGKLTYKADNAKIGKYTLTVSDKKHKYADITTTFTLTTDATPITYDSEKASLVTADGYTADDLAAYVKSIESVSVDGTSYAASGRGAVKIIKEDGSIDATAKPFANAKDGQEFEIVVKATGYAKDYTFTYKYEDEDAYVLMNIPYSAFYKEEVNNDVDVDVFTSATLNKTRTASLAGGSYHVNADGSQIDGITFPVKVDKDVDLSKYTQVTDSDSVDITVTNRGQTSTTTYTGKDALFQNADYAYYKLTEVPSYYKEVSVDKDGNLTFGKTVGNVTTLEGLSAELSTETGYGDYQLDIDGLRDKLTELGVTNINGVVINTKEGSSYGLRHLENIWRMEELAWAAGFTEAVHGCPTSSDHYKAMMGQTITSVTYYTDKGMYNIPLADIYVPVKFTHDLEVANAAITAGKTEVTVTGLPDDYAAEYKVDGLDGVSVQNGVLTFSNAKKGKYTLTISDKNDKYADITTEFELYTEAMPAAYDADKKVLVKTADATDEEFADYINNITSVNVNGTDYKASGRGATVIINKDGSIKTDAAPFAEGDTFEITVSATGYLPQSFTYTTKEAPAPAEVNTEALKATIAKAEGLKEADYTADSWAAMQTSLTSAKAALESKESQEAVDAASASLQSSIDALKAATPAETEEETKDDKKDETEAVDTAALEKVIATAKGLKKNDYTAATWSTLQTALTNAEKALDAKESQKSVDEAAKTLQAAIDGLKKAADTTATTDDKKNNNNNNNSTNKNNTTNKNTTTSKNSPKTGDPVSVLGLLGAAISSVGIGGLGLRLRKKSKREDEE